MTRRQGAAPSERGPAIDVSRAAASVDGEAPCVRSQLRLSQLRLSQLRLTQATQPLPLCSLLVVWWASTAPPLPPAADSVRGAQVRGEGGRARGRGLGRGALRGGGGAAGRPQRHVRFVGRNADRLFPTSAGGQSCTGKRTEATCRAPQLRGTAEKRTAQIRCGCRS